MEDLYDVVIVGGGPAGLTAALYLARAQYRVIVLEKEKFGGQITITSEVVNYPGIMETTGAELTEEMRKQAENFGAEFMMAEVTKINADEDIKVISTSKGEIRCFGVVLATGANPRPGGFEGEDKFKGRGIAYCATCDGEFFRDKEVFVVGGGFAAAEEAVFLTKYASHVTVMVRGEDFTCAKSVADHTRSNEKITVLTNTTVESVTGENRLEAIHYVNNITGEKNVYKADNNDTFGVFVFTGYAPQTRLYEGIAELTEAGYVVTDRNQQTNIEGLYAAGDVCVKPLRQVVTAVGDGAIAATELERYVTHMHKKTGLVPKAKKPQKVADNKAVQVSENKVETSEIFDSAMLAQLNAVFDRMENNIILRLYLNGDKVENELEHYMENLVGLTDKLALERVEQTNTNECSCVHICDAEGEWLGLAFHGVPGGHEFTSFILGIYNAAGPGQKIDSNDDSRIKSINKETDIKIIVSLSCTMCPDLVIAAQHIAAKNKHVKSQVYDISYFPELREKYNIMSVPCMIINDGEKIEFGKKNISQILDIIG